MKSILFAALVAASAPITPSLELLPKNTVPFQGPTYIYRVPLQDAEQSADNTCGVKFDTYDRGSKTRMEKFDVAVHPTEWSILRILRRTYYNSVGSGREFYATSVRMDEPGLCIRSITVNATRTYQQGLIGKFPVPELDVDEALQAGIFNFKGEFASPYPDESINANFLRMAKHRKPGKGLGIEVDGKIAYIDIKCYPYRNGSKCVYAAAINGVVEGNTVDFVKAAEALAEAVDRIAND